jgi:hypothetical protein
VTVIHLHQQLPKLIVPKTAQETLGNSNTLKNGRHEYLCDKLDPLQLLLHPQLGYIIIHILFQPETEEHNSQSPELLNIWMLLHYTTSKLPNNWDPSYLCSSGIAATPLPFFTVPEAASSDCPRLQMNWESSGSGAGSWYGLLLIL